MSSSTIFSNATDFVTSFIGKKNKSVARAPQLASPVRFPHGAFQLKIQLASGSDYQLQASTDLRHWVTLAEDTAAGETVEYLDTGAHNCGFRFYRAWAGTFCSTNVIGYASITVPPGFAMIANPFRAPSNAVGALFPKLPDGTTLSKFDTKLYRLAENLVKDGKWKNPNDTLVPGEGAILYNPTSDFKTLDFVGEVMQGNLLNPIPSGFSIRSSLIPQPGRLHTDLGFPLSDGDVIHIFDRDKQSYAVYEYPSKQWETNPAVISIGESFWVGKTSPGNWTRNFVVGAEE